MSSNPFDNPEVAPMFWDEQQRMSAARWLSKNTKSDQLKRNLDSVKTSLVKILTGQEKPPHNETPEAAIVRLNTMMQIWDMALKFATAN